MAKRMTPREVAVESVKIETFPPTRSGRVMTGYEVRVCCTLVYRGEDAERAYAVYAASRDAVELYERKRRTH